MTVSFSISRVKTISSQTSYTYEGGVGIPPELIALTLALTLYTATFIAENVRAGIQGIGKGQKEAAASIGLNTKPSFKISDYASSFKNYNSTYYKSIFKFN